MKSKLIPSRRCIVMGLFGFIAIGVIKIPAATPWPENIQWVLVEMNGRAVGPDVKKWRAGSAYLMLDAATKRASGGSFVNQFGGSYELKDGTLKFGMMMSTEMAGSPEAMDAEQEYMKMLVKVTGWRIADGKLELLQDDKVVARFKEWVKAQL